MDVIYNPNLVLYLPLWKRDGVTIRSDDGFGHICAKTGTTWGIQGSTFNGTSDKIVVPTNAAFNVASFTMAAWIKTSNAGAGRTRIMSRQTDPNYMLMSLNGNVLELGSSLDTILTTKGAALNDDAWHLIQVTRQAGVSANWFTDGQIVDTQAITNSSAYSLTDDMGIGARSNGEETYAGMIGEVFFFTRGHTPLEAQNLYLATKGRPYR